MSLMPKWDWSFAVKREITGSFKTPFIESSASLSSFSPQLLVLSEEQKIMKKRPDDYKRINTTVKKMQKP